MRYFTAFILFFAVLLSAFSCADPDDSPDNYSCSVSAGLGSNTSGGCSQTVDELSSLPEETDQERELLGAAVSLIESDKSVIDLVVLRSIAGKNPVIDYSSHRLNASSPYYRYSALAELLSGVYTDAGAEELIGFPSFGEKAVSNSDGITCYSAHYIPDFKAYLLSDTISVVSYDKNSAVISAYADDSELYTLILTKTDSGWRLDSSFYFVYNRSEHRPSWEQSGLKKGQNEGSGARLSGSNLVVNIFVTDRKTDWAESDIQNALAMQAEGLDFLVRQSTVFGVEGLTFKATDRTESLFLKTSDTFSTAMDDFLWIDLLFADTTYRSLEGYVRENFDVDAYDNYTVTLHVNKKGRSYSLPCNSTYYDYKLYNTERSVVFYSTDKNYSYCTKSGVYVHELLHLYGADDLYDDLIPDNIAEKIDAYYKNEIMLTIPSDVEQACVSLYTAYLIGWTDRMSEIFE